MNRLALLFGYCYKDGEDSTLKSSYFDLFIAYNYLSERGFHCLVFDDLSCLNTVEHMYDKKDINVDFLSFHHNKGGIHYSKHDIQDCYPKMTEVLQELLGNCNQLFFYYTGHMTKESDFCFANIKVKVDVFLTHIGRLLQRTCQVCCLVDSCYSGVNLFPYTFNGQKIVLRSDFETSIFALKQECIYIHSANSDEQAVSSKYRSYFTKYIFRQLETGIPNFNILLDETQKRIAVRKKHEVQTAGISTSYRMPARLWPWVFGYNFKDCGEYFVFD